MYTYIIRVPRWAQKIYSKATWYQDPESYPVHPLWTIDDGPNPESTLIWLEMLDKLGQKGIFFFTGKNAERYPALVQQVRSEGHGIGGHGYGHLDGWKTKKDVYIKDVHLSMVILETELFRPPYGRMTWGQYRSLSSTFRIMMWSMVSWDYNKSVSSEDISKCINFSRSNDIIVFHDHQHAAQKVWRALKRIN